MKQNKKKNPLLSSVRVNQKTDQQKKVIKSLTKYIFENIIFSNFNLPEYFIRIHVDHFQAIKKNIKEIVLNP